MYYCGTTFRFVLLLTSGKWFSVTAATNVTSTKCRRAFRDWRQRRPAWNAPECMKVPDLEHAARVMLTRMRGIWGVFSRLSPGIKAEPATPCNMHGLSEATAVTTTVSGHSSQIDAVLLMFRFKSASTEGEATLSALHESSVMEKMGRGAEEE